MLSGPAGSAAAVMLRARGEGAGVPRRPWRDLLTRIGRTPLCDSGARYLSERFWEEE